MDGNDAALELERLAKAEEAAWVKRLPADPAQRFACFVTATRAVDYFAFLRPRTGPDFVARELLNAGWNVLTAMLFADPGATPVMPIFRSTEAHFEWAVAAMRTLGGCAMARRVAPMLRAGVLVAEDRDVELIVRMAPGLELGHLRDRAENVELARLGSERASGRVVAALRDDIDDLMRPLIHPWRAGEIVIAGYDARSEVDEHFLALASPLVLDLCDSAGIHPKAAIGGVAAESFIAVCGLVVSFQMKHARFCSLLDRHPEIGLRESLTIWKPRSLTVETVCAITGFAPEVVGAALNCIAMTSGDVPRLGAHISPFRPPLIDCGNGIDLWPVSSLTRNPFVEARILQQWRDPKGTSALVAPREEWLREELYALFMGTRYRCTPGAVDLKKGGNTVTDLDAAVFDVTTGELALFQIKWQDFATHDFRELSSRAKNFAASVDAWAGAVSAWIEERGLDALQRCLRLKLVKGQAITSVRLFALTRQHSRFQAWASVLDRPDLAIANWAQFVLLRQRLGPAEHVIDLLHASVREEAKAPPPPYDTLGRTCELSGRAVRFADFWQAAPDTQ